MCSVDHIHAELDTRPDQHMFGPPVNSALNIEPQRPQKLSPITSKYVTLFLTGSVTPRYHFTHIYPQIITDGLGEAKMALTIFMQACITKATAGDDTSVLNSTDYTIPARNDRNWIRRDQLFDVFFPAHSAGEFNISHDGIHRELTLVKDQSAR